MLISAFLENETLRKKTLSGNSNCLDPRTTFNNRIDLILDTDTIMVSLLSRAKRVGYSVYISQNKPIAAICFDFIYRVPALRVITKKS